MPSKQDFERHVNEQLQGTTTQCSDEGVDDDVNVKKQHDQPTSEPEAEDFEFSEKKDRPPRFSTLFGATPPATRDFESYPQPKRKSGVFVPLPLFILFVVILLFESTLLFAYTTIGLYNNLPSRLIPAGGGCDCGMLDRQPAVNIAPNFLMPQAQATVTEMVTLGALGDTLPTSIATSTTLATSTTSINTSSEAAAIASEVLGLVKTLTTSSSASSSSSSSATPNPGATTTTEILSELQPPPSVVNSITYLTVTPTESSVPPRPTVTSTYTPDLAASAAISSRTAAESSVEAALSSLSAALAPIPIAPSTTLATSASPSSSLPTTTPSPSPSSVSPPVPSSATNTSPTRAQPSIKLCVAGYVKGEDCMHHS